MSVLSGGNRGLLAVNLRLLLHVLDGGDYFAPGDAVAFLYVQVCDAAHGGGAQIYVGLGLDLAGSAYHGRQILPDNRGGEHLGVARLLFVHHCRNKATRNKDPKNDKNDFLHEYDACSDCLFSVYAKTPIPVPAG